MLQAQWQWRSTREGRAREGRGAGREREGVYLAHRHLPVAANGFTRALLVDPRVRALAATGCATTTAHWTPLSHHHRRRRRRRQHVKDAAQDVAEDVAEDAAQDLAFGARAARALLATSPPPPPPSLCSSR